MQLKKLIFLTVLLTTSFQASTMQVTDLEKEIIYSSHYCNHHDFVNKTCRCNIRNYLPKNHLNQNTNKKNSNLQRNLFYLGGLGLFTSLGIYSYYKCSHDSWKRSLLFGFSLFGGSCCSFLSIKNLIQSESW